MIPKIFHRIWLGSNIPKTFEDYWAAWQRAYPEYEFKTWTEKEIDLLSDTKHLITKAKTFAGKSDIARLEILKRYGGIYLDTDFIPYHRFNIEEFGAFSVCNEDPKWLEVCSNGFIASEPDNPILDDYLSAVKSKINRYDNPVLETGPGVFLNILKRNTGFNVIPSESLYPYRCYEAFSRIYERDLSATVGIHIWKSSWFKDDMLHKQLLGPLKSSHDAREVLDNIHRYPVNMIPDIVSYAKNMISARSGLYELVHSKFHPFELINEQCFTPDKVLFYLLTNKAIESIGIDEINTYYIVRPIINLFNANASLNISDHENAQFEPLNGQYDAILTSDPDKVFHFKPKYIHIKDFDMELRGYIRCPNNSYLRKDIYEMYSRYLFVDSGLKIYNHNQLFI